MDGDTRAAQPAQSRKRPLGGLLDAHMHVHRLNALPQHPSAADMTAWTHERFAGLAAAAAAGSGAFMTHMYMHPQQMVLPQMPQHDRALDSVAERVREQMLKPRVSSGSENGENSSDDNSQGGGSAKKLKRSAVASSSSSGGGSQQGQSESDSGQDTSAAGSDASVGGAGAASSSDLILMAACSLRGSNRSTQFCSVCLGIRRTKGELYGGHRPDGWCPVRQRRASADEKRELRRRRQKLRRAIQKRSPDAPEDAMQAGDGDGDVE